GVVFQSDECPPMHALLLGRSMFATATGQKTPIVRNARRPSWELHTSVHRASSAAARSYASSAMIVHRLWRMTCLLNRVSVILGVPRVCGSCGQMSRVNEGHAWSAEPLALEDGDWRFSLLPVLSETEIQSLIQEAQYLLKRWRFAASTGGFLWVQPIGPK